MKLILDSVHQVKYRNKKMFKGNKNKLVLGKTANRSQQSSQCNLKQTPLTLIHPTNDRWSIAPNNINPSFSLSSKQNKKKSLDKKSLNKRDALMPKLRLSNLVREKSQRELSSRKKTDASEQQQQVFTQTDLTKMCEYFIQKQSISGTFQLQNHVQRTYKLYSVLLDFSQKLNENSTYNEYLKNKQKLNFQNKNVNFIYSPEFLQKKKNLRIVKSFWFEMKGGNVRIGEGNENRLKRIQTIHTHKHTKYDLTDKSNWKAIQNQCKKLYEQKQNIEIDIISLRQQEEAIQKKVQANKLTLEKQEHKIHELSAIVDQLLAKTREFDEFINKQPNQILREEAVGYKEREQELFDAAFMAEETTPDDIPEWVHRTLLVQTSNLEVTLQGFPNILPIKVESVYELKGEAIDKFKKSMKKDFNVCLDKLTDMLKKKCARLKQIVDLMRRLASYTIGKRQYMDEINEMMTATWTKLDNIFKVKESKSKLGDIAQIKALAGNMWELYKKAGVFY